MKTIFIFTSVMVVLFFAAPLQGQTPQKIQDINKKVVGKWWSGDRKSYIEFLPDGACSEGAFYDGTWHTEQGKLSAWERGKQFTCIDGALNLIAPNTLIRDIGMGGVLTRYYRGVQQPKPTPESAACSFCGVWEYVDNGHQLQRDGKHYLKISRPEVASLGSL